LKRAQFVFDSMKIIVENLAVEYEDTGVGPVMLLLHGWKDSLRTFDALVPVLSETNRIVRLDLPGFGGSELPSETWGVGEYALFVKHFCEKLSIQPDVLVGHSFGGRVVIKGLGEGILTSRKAVLIASAGLPKHKSLRNRAFLVVAKLGKLISWILPGGARREVRRKLYTKTGSDYLGAGALRDIFLKTRAEDLRNNARRIAIPTLLIWGENDHVTPLSDGKQFNTLIQGSVLSILPKVGHFVHKEESVAVTGLIKEFLS